MPPSRPSPPRRRVVPGWATVAGAVAMGLLGLIGLLGISPAAAVPYAVDPGPALTLPAEATFVVGRAGDAYLIEADGDPVPAIVAGALPPGLTVTAHGDGSATLAGVPTGPAGETLVEFRAQNSSGTSVELLSVVVQQPPSFVSRGPLTFAPGEFSSVVVRTVGYPQPSIGLEGDLPAGLLYVDNGNGTATVSGTPAEGQTSAPITLTAVNVVADASLTTTVDVVARPDASLEPVMPLSTTGPRRAP